MIKLKLGNVCKWTVFLVISFLLMIMVSYLFSVVSESSLFVMLLFGLIQFYILCMAFLFFFKQDDQTKWPIQASNALDVPVAFVLTKNSKIIFINLAGIQLLDGKHESQFKGVDIRQFLHQYFYPVDKNISTFLNGEGYFQKELLTLAGNKIETKVRVEKIKADQETFHFLLFSHVSKANQIKEMKQREFKEALVRLKGFTQLVQNEQVGQTTEKVYTDVMMEDIENITELFNELMTLEREAQ